MDGIYDLIVKKLPRHPEDSRHRLWVNENDEIMCKTVGDANVIANLFEELGYDIMHTCYYDDAADGLCFGWYAVYVDGM